VHGHRGLEGVPHARPRLANGNHGLRASRERRAKRGSTPAGDERRKVRAWTGRRVADRRATTVPIDPLPLPRKAAKHAERLLFVERLEPSGQESEDRDTARLVAAIQAGDSERFAELYMRYFDRVYGYLNVVFRDSHEAEDAAQQVFLNVLEALPRYERRTQPFRAWMFVIVRRHALERLEKSHRVDVVDPVELNRRSEANGEAQAEPGVSALDWISDPELLLFVERMPSAQRQVLMLRYMLDLDYGDIAKLMDRKIDDVRMLHHRARRFLEQRLRALGRGPRVGREQERARTFLRQAPVLRARRYALKPGARARGPGKR
jgi:RNA polymerase sigma factor (sigma-70 family)